MNEFKFTTTLQISGNVDQAVLDGIAANISFAIENYNQNHGLSLDTDNEEPDAACVELIVGTITNPLPKIDKIEKYYLYQSGGHCMLDVFNLDNGQCIACTDEGICHYDSWDCGEPTEDEGVLCYDFLSNKDFKDLESNDIGSVILESDSTSLTFLNGQKLEVSELLAIAFKMRGASHV